MSPRRQKPTADAAARVSEVKVAKSYRLSPAKIARAQKILGAPTATATIEEALDMIVFRQELLDGTRAIAGLEITTVFPDGERR